MDSKLFILILGSVASLSFGAQRRELIDLCSNTTNSGWIVYNESAYKTWHFMSCGCHINGTINFTYNMISAYFWQPFHDDDEIRNTLQITGIPAPLWKETETFVSKSIHISNDYGVVMTYDARKPNDGGYTPAINISYHFDNFGGGNPTTTTQTTNEATRTSFAIDTCATNELTALIVLICILATSTAVSFAVFTYILRR